jgi:predicted dienelactone hydrolase
MNPESSTKPGRSADATDERGFLGLLRASARITVLVGAAGSVGLMLWAGRRNESRILLVLFALWVLSPFVALVLANVASKRWSVVSRAALHSVILVFTLVILAIYGNAVLGPPKGKSAFVFIVVPPASWLLFAIFIPPAALIFGWLFRTRLDRRILRDFAVLAMLGVLGIGSLLGALWLEHRTEITLPTPTGSFAVGRAIYDWDDDEHRDTLAPVPGTKREVLVWFWYPSAPGQSIAVSDYVPPQLRAGAAPQKTPLGSLILGLLTRDLSKVHSHSIPNADVSPQERAYPVVIMRTGASLGVLTYSTLAEDLASHGYIVVGFDAPYRTGRLVFPDGRVIERTPENNPELYAGQPHADRLNQLLTAWTADIGFVLDRLERLNASDPSGKFTGRLDMTRVGIFGHSFGGAQAAQFCYQDSRCKAGIDVDGRLLGSVVEAGLHQPFMFLLSDQNSSDPQSRQIKADIQSIYDRLPADGRLRIVIHGANHFTFSDDGALLKSHVLRGLLRVLGKLDIEGRRQLAVTAYCIHSFFHAYLKGENVSRLNISSPLYPEIQVIE